MTTLLLLMLAGQATDIWSTHRALKAGCEEAGVVFRHLPPASIVPAKTGMAVALAFTVPRLHNKTGAKAVLGVFAISGFVGGIHNFRTLPRCRH